MLWSPVQRIKLSFWTGREEEYLIDAFCLQSLQLALLKYEFLLGT